MFNYATSLLTTKIAMLNTKMKISTQFRIRIKENCKLQTQRPSKVPIHYRDRLNKLLVELFSRTRKK